MALPVVAVIGAGTMGAGIALVAATAGHDVLLYDANADQVRSGLAGLVSGLAARERKGRLSAADRVGIEARLHPAASLDDLTDAGLVIEAIVESLPIKRQVFGELERVVAAAAILASNTSSLSITDLAAGMVHPGRVVGMHFFNPAPVLPLVEVVSGAETDPTVAQAVFDLATAWGKIPVRATSTPGFIVNRVARPYYNEPFAAYEAGIADPGVIDAVLRDGAGFRMGPFELTDLIGQDVNSAVSASVWDAFDRDPRFTPSPAQRELVAAGRLGRKSGEGWFSYDADGKQVPPRNARAAPELTPPRKALPAKDKGPGAPELFVPGTEPGVLTPLFERIAGAGIDVRPGPADYLPAPLAPRGAILPGLGSMWLTAGLTAATMAGFRNEPVVLIDLGDFATATHVGIATSPDCPDALRAAVIRMLEAAGLEVSELADSPGLVAARTVAMLVNLAADAVEARVATANDVDLAMVKGVNYPRGALEWGDVIGPAYVVDVLDNLAASALPDADHRYRVSPWLRERALRGEPLR